MRVALVGFGSQGRKWNDIVKVDYRLIADPVVDGARECIQDIPPTAYDAAIVAVPNHVKYDIVDYIVNCGKHVLVEKPLIPFMRDLELKTLALHTYAKDVVLHTSYNLIHDPAVASLRELLLEKGDLGEIYHSRLFYGYGTAQIVKGTWRDSRWGVLSEVGSHLVHLAYMLFGEAALANPKMHTANTFECNVCDHMVFQTNDQIQCEASWVNWKNVFEVDVYGSKGSAHIRGLTKWGRSTFILRTRVLPSGAPHERSTEFCGETKLDNTLVESWKWFNVLIGHKPVNSLQLDRELLHAMQRIVYG